MISLVKNTGISLIKCCLLVACLSPLLFAACAQGDEGLDSESMVLVLAALAPDERVQTFTASQLQNMRNGTLEGDEFVVARSGLLRGGCSFNTPIITSPYEKGRLDVRINFNARWVGFLDSETEPEAAVFRIGVLTPSNYPGVREYITTEHMEKTVDYVESPTRSHYFAVTPGEYSDFSFNGIEVVKGEEIKVSACDFWEGVSARIRSVTLRVYPVE